MIKICVFFTLFISPVYSQDAPSPDSDFMAILSEEFSSQVNLQSSDLVQTMDSIRNIKSLFNEKTFNYLIETGFYGGLLDYPWKNSDKIIPSDPFLDQTIAVLEKKSLSPLTKKISNGCIEDINLLMNPNYKRRIKNAPMFNRENELKASLILPYLNLITKYDSAALQVQLIPIYEFALRKSYNHLLTFALLSDLPIPATPISGNNHDDAKPPTGEEKTILEEIDDLTKTRNEEDSPSNPGLKWIPK